MPLLPWPAVKGIIEEEEEEKEEVDKKRIT